MCTRRRVRGVSCPAARGPSRGGGRGRAAANTTTTTRGSTLYPSVPPPPPSSSTSTPSTGTKVSRGRMFMCIVTHMYAHHREMTTDDDDGNIARSSSSCGVPRIIQRYAPPSSTTPSFHTPPRDVCAYDATLAALCDSLDVEACVPPPATLVHAVTRSPSAFWDFMMGREKPSRAWQQGHPHTPAPLPLPPRRHRHSALPLWMALEADDATLFHMYIRLASIVCEYTADAASACAPAAAHPHSPPPPSCLLSWLSNMLDDAHGTIMHALARRRAHRWTTNMARMVRTLLSHAPRLLTVRDASPYGWTPLQLAVTQRVTLFVSVVAYWLKDHPSYLHTVLGGGTHSPARLALRMLLTARQQRDEEGASAPVAAVARSQSNARRCRRRRVKKRAEEDDAEEGNAEEDEVMEGEEEKEEEQLLATAAALPSNASPSIVIKEAAACLNVLLRVHPYLATHCISCVDVAASVGAPHAPSSLIHLLTSVGILDRVAMCKDYESRDTHVRGVMYILSHKGRGPPHPPSPAPSSPPDTATEHVVMTTSDTDEAATETATTATASHGAVDIDTDAALPPPATRGSMVYTCSLTARGVVPTSAHRVLVPSAAAALPLGARTHADWLTLGDREAVCPDARHATLARVLAYAQKQTAARVTAQLAVRDGDGGHERASDDIGLGSSSSSSSAAARRSCGDEDGSMSSLASPLPFILNPVLVQQKRHPSHAAEEAAWTRQRAAPPAVAPQPLCLSQQQQQQQRTTKTVIAQYAVVRWLASFGSVWGSVPSPSMCGLLLSQHAASFVEFMFTPCMLLPPSSCQPSGASAGTSARTGAGTHTKTSSSAATALPLTAAALAADTPKLLLYAYLMRAVWTHARHVLPDAIAYNEEGVRAWAHMLIDGRGRNALHALCGVPRDAWQGERHACALRILVHHVGLDPRVPDTTPAAHTCLSIATCSDNSGGRVTPAACCLIAACVPLLCRQHGGAAPRTVWVGTEFGMDACGMSAAVGARMCHALTPEEQQQQQQQQRDAPPPLPAIRLACGARTHGGYAGFWGVSPMSSAAASKHQRKQRVVRSRVEGDAVDAAATTVDAVASLPPPTYVLTWLASDAPQRAKCGTRFARAPPTAPKGGRASNVDTAAAAAAADADAKHDTNDDGGVTKAGVMSDGTRFVSCLEFAALRGHMDTLAMLLRAEPDLRAHGLTASRLRALRARCPASVDAIRAASWAFACNADTWTAVTRGLVDEEEEEEEGEVLPPPPPPPHRDDTRRACVRGKDAGNSDVDCGGEEAGDDMSEDGGEGGEYTFRCVSPPSPPPVATPPPTPPTTTRTRQHARAAVCSEERTLETMRQDNMNAQSSLPQDQDRQPPPPEGGHTTVASCPPPSPSSSNPRGHVDTACMTAEGGGGGGECSSPIHHPPAPTPKPPRRVTRAFARSRLAAGVEDRRTPSPVKRAAAAAAAAAAAVGTKRRHTPSPVHTDEVQYEYRGHTTTTSGMLMDFEDECTTFAAGTPLLLPLPPLSPPRRHTTTSERAPPSVLSTPLRLEDCVRTGTHHPRALCGGSLTPSTTATTASPSPRSKRRCVRVLSFDAESVTGGGGALREDEDDVDITNSLPRSTSKESCASPLSMACAVLGGGGGGGKCVPQLQQQQQQQEKNAAADANADEWSTLTQDLMDMSSTLHHVTAGGATTPLSSELGACVPCDDEGGGSALDVWLQWTSCDTMPLPPPGGDSGGHANDDGDAALCERAPLPTVGTLSPVRRVTIERTSDGTPKAFKVQLAVPPPPSVTATADSGSSSSSSSTHPPSASDPSVAATLELLSRSAALSKECDAEVLEAILTHSTYCFPAVQRIKTILQRSPNLLYDAGAARGGHTLLCAAVRAVRPTDVATHVSWIRFMLNLGACALQECACEAAATAAVFAPTLQTEASSPPVYTTTTPTVTWYGKTYHPSTCCALEAALRVCETDVASYVPPPPPPPRPDVAASRVTSMALDDVPRTVSAWLKSGLPVPSAVSTLFACAPSAQLEAFARGVRFVAVERAGTAAAASSSLQAHTVRFVDARVPRSTTPLNAAAFEGNFVRARVLCGVLFPNLPRGSFTFDALDAYRTSPLHALCTVPDDKWTRGHALIMHMLVINKATAVECVRGSQCLPIMMCIAYKTSRAMHCLLKCVHELVPDGGPRLLQRAAKFLTTIGGAAPRSTVLDVARTHGFTAGMKLIQALMSANLCDDRGRSNNCPSLDVMLSTCHVPGVATV